MSTALARRIPNDPGLPGLAQLFDVAGAPSVAAEMVKEETGAPVDANSGELVYVRYKPTRDCVAQWAFPTTSDQFIFVSAKLFSGRKGADLISGPDFRRFAGSIRSGANWSPEPYRYLDDRQVLFQLFPMDVKLPGLPLATSDSWAAEVFAPALGLSSKETCITEITPVSYKAWHRCVLRYAVESHRGQLQCFAKLFRDDRGEAMFARLSCLKAKLSSLSVPWEIPAPATYISEARMLLLEALEDGVELSSLLKDAPDNPLARTALLEHVAQASQALVAFQRIVIEGVPSVTPKELVRSLSRKAKGLHDVAPGLACSIEAQLHNLDEWARRLPAEPIVLAHGAFRHTQMLACGEKLGLLDLDGLRLAGTSADAGEFLAHLDRTALRRPRLRPVIREMTETFVAGLRTHPYLDQRWLTWHRAAEHLKYALRSFLALPLMGRETAEDLVALSAEAR